MNHRLGTMALRILVVVLTALLGAAVADRVTGFTQKRYVAAVTLQVRSEDVSDPKMPRRAETTRELILSREVLEPVTKSLAVTGTDPVSTLRRAISIKEIRNTELVQISVAATSPNEAARQANGVAEEFQRTLMNAVQKQRDLRLETLQAEVDAQRAKVRERKADAQKIRIEAGINDLDPDGLEQSGELADAINKGRSRTAMLEAQHARLSELSDPQVLDEISRGTEFGNSLDPTLSEISTQLRLAKSEETTLAAKGASPEDPPSSALSIKISALQKQLSDLVPILRHRIENAAQEGKAQLQWLEKFAAEPYPKMETTEEYQAAKEEYIKQRKILESAEMKRAVESIDRAMPRNPAVIWERAEPPSAPDSRPRVMLALGALVGLLVGAALAFLPRPGITAGIVLVLLGVVSFPRWAGSSPAPIPPPAEKKFIPRISVGGDVKSPQLLDFAEDLTVLRVINAAGGFTEYANRKKVRLLRDGKVVVIDVTAIVADPGKDIPLQPGDSIEVPQNFW